MKLGSCNEPWLIFISTPAGSLNALNEMFHSMEWESFSLTILKWVTSMINKQNKKPSFCVTVPYHSFLLLILCVMLEIVFIRDYDRLDINAKIPHTKIRVKKSELTSAFVYEINSNNAATFHSYESDLLNPCGILKLIRTSNEMTMETCFWSDFYLHIHEHCPHVMHWPCIWSTRFKVSN